MPRPGVCTRSVAGWSIRQTSTLTEVVVAPLHFDAAAAVVNFSEPRRARGVTDTEGPAMALSSNAAKLKKRVGGDGIGRRRNRIVGSPPPVDAVGQWRACISASRIPAHWAKKFDPLSRRNQGSISIHHYIQSPC